MEEKEEFSKVSVKSEVKHRIDIIAATERRFVYEVVEDMLKLYVAVTSKSPTKSPKSRNGKKSKPMSDVTAKYHIEKVLST